MIKKILLNIIVAAMCLHLWGCVNLDEDAVDFVAPENFYQTEAQINAALAAAWGSLGQYYQEFDIRIYQITDHADDIDVVGGLGLRLEGLQSTGGLGRRMLRTWRDFYRGIAGMNNGIKSLENASIPEDNKQVFEGQLRFTRAFYYYNLVRYWGGVPLNTEELTAEELQNLTRSPEDEVYAFIVRDLERAAELLPDSWAEGSGARPTRMVTKGLLSTVYLNWATRAGNAERYTKARDLAKEVINSGQHALIENVNDVFLNENQFASEFLLSVQHVDQRPFSATDPNIWTPGAYLDGWGSFAVDTVMQNKYPEQPRKYAYLLVGTPEDNGTFTPFADGRWYCRKYIPPYISVDEYGTRQSPANTPLLRYPEILLTYAEADNFLSGPQTEAVTAFNLVRDRANGYGLNPDAPLLDAGNLTKEEFLKEILNERLFELNFEHVRIFDLLRHRMLPEANPMDPDFDEGDYRFPVPLGEIEETGGRVKQNPGNYDDLGFGFFTDN